MKASEVAFDFEKWFRWRFSRYTPDGAPRCPGTFTMSEDDLLVDLIYDYRTAHGLRTKRQNARNSTHSICQEAIRNANCLGREDRGYFLKGEPRIRFDAMWRIVEDNEQLEDVLEDHETKP